MGTSNLIGLFEALSCTVLPKLVCLGEFHGVI